MIFSRFPSTELWRLAIDRYQHDLGPYAFDNSRGKAHTSNYHAGEAGYLKAMLEGLNYVAQQPLAPVSLQLITTLHKIATMDVEDGEKTTIDPDLNKEDRVLMKDLKRGKVGHAETSSFILNRSEIEQPGANNVSKSGFIELAAWLKENQEYQHYFSITAKNTAGDEIKLEPSSSDASTFYETHNNILWNCIKIKEEDIKEIIEDKLTEFNRKIEEAGENKDEKLNLIVKLIHELEIIHPFSDGNCRTFVLLLNHLLIQNQLSPVLLLNPNRFDGFSINELINEVQNGQSEYEKYLVTHCINRIESINPYHFDRDAFKNELSKLLAKEPHICIAQLNFIYQLINDKKIHIPEKEVNLVLCMFPVPGKNTVKREILTVIKGLFNEIKLEINASNAIQAHIEGYDLYKDTHKNDIPDQPRDNNRSSPSSR